MLIHGLVRDDKGRKMSKSLGNGIDPLEIAEKYGADALRFNLVTGNSPGNDMRFYTERCEAMRNFANKIWNASRFLMMNLTIDKCELPREAGAGGQVDPLQAQPCLSARSPRTWTSMSWAWPPRRSMTSSGTTYCDWYIELTKTRLQGDDRGQQGPRPSRCCATSLTEMLKLLHPFMPFITEEIWQALPHEGDFLMLSQWPRSATAATSPRRRRPWSSSWTPFAPSVPAAAR